MPANLRAVPYRFPWLSKLSPLPPPVAQKDHFPTLSGDVDLTGGGLDTQGFQVLQAQEQVTFVAENDKEVPLGDPVEDNRDDYRFRRLGEGW